MAFRGPADGVFEGGGVKVAALAGAVEVADQYVSEWRSLAGTSGGAIVAGLLAAGYKGPQIWGFLSGDGVTDGDETVLPRFKPSSLMKRRALWGLPVVSPVANALTRLGAYSADEFESYLTKLLSHKGVRTFGDLHDKTGQVRPEQGLYRLRVIATDLTNRRTLVLPQDVDNPEEFSVARAIRMSMSVPLIFEPAYLDPEPPSTRRRVIVDGGVTSNYPVWLFDAQPAHWPTFGFLLDERPETPRKITGLLGLGSQLLGMRGGLDHLLAERTAGNRTIRINVDGFSSFTMNLSRAQRQQLRMRGRHAAQAFFAGFNPNEYHNSAGVPLNNPASFLQ